MSITSSVFLKRFSKIQREGSFPSCLVHTCLGLQANQFVKGCGGRVGE